jgi:hypothetical protein
MLPRIQRATGILHQRQGCLFSLRPFSTEDINGKRYHFPWREATTRRKGLLFNLMEVTVPKHLLFRVIQHSTEEEFLEGAKMALRTSLTSIFRHPDLINYHKELQTKVQQGKETTTTTTTTSTTDSNNEDTSVVNMNDIFDSDVSKFYQSSIDHFIQSQRKRMELPASVPSSAIIVHELLDIHSATITKIDVGLVPGITAPVVKEQFHSLPSTLPANTGDRERFNLVNFDITVDFRCKGTGLFIVVCCFLFSTIFVLFSSFRTVLCERLV